MEYRLRPLGFMELLLLLLLLYPSPIPSPKYYTNILHQNTLAQRLECSPMARETWVQSQVESYQRL